MLKYNPHDVIFDIETEGATTLDFIQEIYPPYPQFVPQGVKCGNLKTEEEKSAKIEAARQDHAAQEAAYWEEKLEKAALNAETGRVVTIGYLLVDAPDEEAFLDDADFNEEWLLRRFWAGYEKVVRRRGRIIGWNSNGFDIPYLIKRSWIIGVPVPATVFRGRWISDTFLDLMQVWSVHEFRKFAKLDACARILGLGNKTDQACCGAEFAKWYRDPERHEAAKRYGLLDLTLTRDIYLRLAGVTSLSGEIEDAEVAS
ncbi:MAG: hypothetical protein GVY36_17100 [Verrucomicrobia bacterium]|jgi:hypothetical protein|nr:hypothetical protein [Verrucomicrobiota bacterium]